MLSTTREDPMSPRNQRWWLTQDDEQVVIAPGGYVLDAGSGEALWFSGGLLTYKTTGDQTWRWPRCTHRRARARRATGTTMKTKRGTSSTAISPSGSASPSPA